MGRDGVNTTVSDAHHIHGTDPQRLVEKILRLKIQDSRYWKEHCFALTAESLVDKAIEIKYQLRMRLRILLAESISCDFVLMQVCRGHIRG